MMLPEYLKILSLLSRSSGEPLYQADIFYSYAKETEKGCIVELGTYRGRGAMALAFGTREGYGLKVYTIDDYSGRKGWIGEPYEPEDKEDFLENIKTAGLENHITLLQMDVLEAASAYSDIWEEGIGLLFWDTGIPNRIRGDFEAWKGYIIPGGVFLMKDAQGYCLGSEEIVAEIENAGGWEIVRYDSLITALRKLE